MQALNHFFSVNILTLYPASRVSFLPFVIASDHILFIIPPIPYPLFFMYILSPHSQLHSREISTSCFCISSKNEEFEKQTPLLFTLVFQGGKSVSFSTRTSSDRAKWYVVRRSCEAMLHFFFTSRQVTSRHFTSLHVTSRHVTSLHFTSLFLSVVYVCCLFVVFTSPTFFANWVLAPFS